VFGVRKALQAEKDKPELQARIEELEKKKIYLQNRVNTNEGREMKQNRNNDALLLFLFVEDNLRQRVGFD